MRTEFEGFTIEEVGKVYKITGNGCPDDMEIYVRKEGTGYRAECNYSAKTKNADAPYQASHNWPTPERTMDDLLLSLKPGENFERYVKT